nr:tetratricopeptide repeat protein [Desulfobacula sp.]
MSVLCHALCFAETEKDLFDAGVLLFKQGQYQESLDKFSRLIEIAPGNADAYKNRGVCYMKQEKYDLAIADFETAKGLFPELKGLYSNLGVAWYYKKEYEKAIQNYDVELEMTPDNYVAHFNRALCLAELHRDPEALDALARTLDLNPDFYWALCYKGDLLARSGETAKAVESYETAVQKDPNNTYAKEKLALLKEKKPEMIGSEAKAAPPEAHTNPEASLSIQAGAFLNRPNADKVKTKLTENGFDADILILKDSKGRDWFLVRSGRYASSKEAKKPTLAIKENWAWNRPFGLPAIGRTPPRFDHQTENRIFRISPSSTT